MTKNNFFDCTNGNLNNSVVKYFCSLLNRTNGYVNFNVRVDKDSVTAWDGYNSVTVSKCDLPNKIARKLFLN